MAPGEPATYKKPEKEIPQYSSKFKIRGFGQGNKSTDMFSSVDNYKCTQYMYQKHLVQVQFQLHFLQYDTEEGEQNSALQRLDI